jgi:hypothetical protein
MGDSAIFTKKSATGISRVTRSNAWVVAGRLPVLSLRVGVIRREM